jgi:hypothetical protein
MIGIPVTQPVSSSPTAPPAQQPNVEERSQGEPVVKRLIVDRKAYVDGFFHQIDRVLGAELVHEPVAVILNRPDGPSQVNGNFPVAFAFDNLSQYPDFAPCESLPLGNILAVAILNRLSDHRKKSCLVQRFFNEIYSPRFDGSYGHGYVSVTAEQKYTHLRTTPFDPLQQLKAAGSGQINVGYNKVTVIVSQRLQTTVRVVKTANLTIVQLRSKRLADRLANLRLVVDKKYYAFFFFRHTKLLAPKFLFLFTLNFFLTVKQFYSE